MMPSNQGISPPCSLSDRPFWSVMIPTYRPDERYLRQAIESVLQQAPGPEQMQIEVVDDCSPEGDVAAIVKSIAGERVKVEQTPRNLGLAGCWNTCIERSRGEWVHIFHQDDLLFPGFYEELESVIRQCPTAGMAFTRFAYINDAGHWLLLGALEAEGAGYLQDFYLRIAEWQRLSCVSVVVKKSSYVSVGSFRSDFPFVLDWEMWVRLAKAFPVCYSPNILAGYRLHEGSQTSRLKKANMTLQDYLRAFESIARELPPEARKQARRAFHRGFGGALMKDAIEFFTNNDPRSARVLIQRFGRHSLASDWLLLAVLWLRCVYKETFGRLKRCGSR